MVAFDPTKTGKIAFDPASLADYVRPEVQDLEDFLDVSTLKNHRGAKLRTGELWHR